MGSSQSKVPDAVAVREQLVERLAALDLKMKEQQATPPYSLEKDYVVLNCAEDAPPSYGPRDQNISISAAQQWQKDLMADPKVCYQIQCFSKERTS